MKLNFRHEWVDSYKSLTIRSVLNRTHLRPRALTLATSLALASVLLVSCSSGSQVSDSPSPSISRQALFAMGVRVCVHNHIPVVSTVTFTQKDSAASEGQLQLGAMACAKGKTIFATGSPVVTGNIAVPGNPYGPMIFEASNPDMGRPNLELSQGVNNERRYCIHAGGMSVGDSRQWDDGVMNFGVTRLPDGETKEFMIDLYNSSKPTADKTQVRCTELYNKGGVEG